MSQTVGARSLGVALLVCITSLSRDLPAQVVRDTARAARDTARIVRDTARPVVDTLGPRPELRPPISPRRAFLYSLLLPGYAQSILGRNRAGALELAFEAVTLIMIQQSAADIREARRNVVDSIPVSFVNAEGQPDITFVRTQFPFALVRSRQAHLEDWIAVLIANHLFSAADGYVAALLWDLPSEVAIGASPRSVKFSLRVFY